MPAYAQKQISDIRVWAGDEYTRTVLDVSGPVDYQVFTLKNPDRVVVDVAGAKATGGLAAPSSKGLLRNVRHAARDGNDLRVVYDLSANVDVKSFLLPPAEQYGHRLVIDLYPSDSHKEPVKKARDFERRKDVLIAIDAGHGGEDPGAIGPKGTHEKDVVLEISRRLAKLVDATPGYQALLIRDGDYYVPHRRRFAKAREARADLFVSVHADAFTDRSVHGSSVYILSERGASSEAARWLARKHNDSDAVGGVPFSDKDDVLKSVLLDLSQNAALDLSRSVASRVLDALKNVGHTHKRHVEHANFLVLKSPDVPSLLVETGFISNPGEENRLLTGSHQQRLAEAILGGIQAHFREFPPPGSYIAQNADASYTVASGDTLSGIATRFGVSLTQLKAVNQLDSATLYPGAVLTIP